MNSKLNYIKDWSKLAESANWSVNEIARHCEVSARTISRHFLRNFGKPAKEWLTEERQKKAMALLLAGNSVKETASKLGFRHAQHFSRDFKGHWGRCPANISIERQKLMTSNCKN